MGLRVLGLRVLGKGLKGLGFRVSGLRSLNPQRTLSPTFRFQVPSGLAFGTVGVLIIRIGFWGFLTIIKV